MSRGDVPVERISLGECDCPGTPHKQDWADCRVRFNFGGLRAINNALERRFFEPTLYKLVAAERGIAAWNLVTTNERKEIVPLEITGQAIDDLDPRQARILIERFDNEGTLDQLYRAGLRDQPAEAGPPNPSGEPSPAGSAETLAPTTSALPGDPTPPTPTASDASSDPPSTSSAPSSPPSSPTTS